MSFFYPGTGRPLRGATSAGVVSDPEVLDIPSGGWSEGFSPSGVDFLISVTVNTGNATGDVVIQRGTDKSFTTTTDHDTIAVNGFRNAVSSNNGPTMGHFRILNSTGQTIRAFLQERIEA